MKIDTTFHRCLDLRQINSLTFRKKVKFVLTQVKLFKSFKSAYPSVTMMLV